MTTTTGDDGAVPEATRENDDEIKTRVIITGGGGFLGQYLAREILSERGRNGRLRCGSHPNARVIEVILADIVEPTESSFPDLESIARDGGVALRFVTGDVSDVDYCRSILLSGGVDGVRDGTTPHPAAVDVDVGLSIFHLGAVMSGAPPDLALKVNLHGTMNMLEAARAWQEKMSSTSSRSLSSSSSSISRPTFIFSSAGATIGAGHDADWVDHHDTISDSTRASPHTTYGTTKACAELLLADYSRRGYCDGRGVRLPTVIVRAGLPNAATTSCYSSVVREPLSGKDVVLPIGPNVLHAVTGCRSAISGILAIHDAMPDDVDRILGYDRTVFLPARPVSLGMLAEATMRVVTRDSAARGMLGEITYDVDEVISGIVGSFPTRVNSSRAMALGAPSVPTVDDIVREYCEDFPHALAEGVVLRAKGGEDDEDFSMPPTPPPAAAAAIMMIEPNVNRVVALITGGGSGIGRATAIRLAGGGWGGSDGKGNNSDGKALRVGLVLVGRRPGPLEETKMLCVDGSSDDVGIDVLTISADVTNEDDVKRIMDLVVAHFARVDLLFNNAGVNIAPTSVEDVESADFIRVIDTNVTACWRMAKGVMRIMSAQTPRGGRIINNGSISAYTPRPFSAPYTASKHAVLGLTKCIALDGRRSNITCGQIDFGNVNSAMTRAVGGSAYSISAGMPQANGTIAPEPCFSVEDAANAVFAMAALPLGANVLSMTVMASHMPFVGRG
jgi:NAD(P)-dependent dehydrogenase (short-subunit alcohol dehydrogenase family)